MGVVGVLEEEGSGEETKRRVGGCLSASALGIASLGGSGGRSALVGRGLTADANGSSAIDSGRTAGRMPGEPSTGETGGDGRFWVGGSGRRCWTRFCGSWEDGRGRRS